MLELQGDDDQNFRNSAEFKSMNITNPKRGDDDEGVNVMSNAKLDLCDESCIPSVVTTSLHLKLSPLLEQEVESSMSYPLQTLYKLCGIHSLIFHDKLLLV